MNSVNTFLSMNSDVARIYQSDKEYLSCKNMRPVTTLGGSNGSLVNIKGNECQLTFPQRRAVYKLAISLATVDDVVDEGTLTISINVGVLQTTGTITINENTTPADINSYIALLSTHYNGTYTGTQRFASAYNSEYVYIYQNPYYAGCEPDSSYAPVITINQLSGTSTINFVTSEGELTVVETPYIAAETDPLVIIGSTFINETIYLFTCGSSNTHSTGQIWELEYDQPTSATSIKLVYNNYVNFSKEFPIPPSAAVGRYEVPTVQRIYWSDNNNPIRSMNVKDPNVFAIEPSILNMRPSAEMSIPTLYNIVDGGATENIATSSTYQCAYRLTKFNGAVTNYSIPSNIVYITPGSILGYSQGNFSGLTGNTSFVNKSIQWEVAGIDTNFDNIEFVLIVRDYPNAEDFVVWRYETVPISGNETLQTEFTNDSATMEEISMEEFLIDNTSFTHCKTIEQKDNRLFYANVRTTLGSYLETFDTRVFRFDEGSKVTEVKVKETDTAITAFTINSDSDYANLDETDDNIPIINLGMQDVDDPTLLGLNPDFADYKYQRLSTTVGGTGPNISFKFGSLLLRSDAEHTTPANSEGAYSGTDRDDVSTQVTFGHGYRRAGVSSDTPISPSFDNGAPNQTYYTRSYAETMGLEYFNGTYKSYQHNEIYRFGIVFHGKQGNRYFVKWIGDIKFPNYNDSVAPGLEGVTDDGTLCSDFRSMIVDSSGAYCNLPYIQFEVNIPVELANLISGYEIVRVKRSESDKTITSQGLINQVSQNSDGVTTQLAPSHFDQEALGIQFLDPETSSTTTDYGSASQHVITYHSFKELADNSTGSISQYDYLMVTEKYKSVTPGVSATTDPTNATIANARNSYYIAKFYELSDFISGNDTFGIVPIYVDEAKFCSQGGETSTFSQTGGTYTNYDLNNAGSECPAIGCATVVISTPNAFDWQDYNDGTDNVASSLIDTSNSKLLAVHVKVSRLKNQYGGRTYTARQANEYISTGAFYPVTEAGTTTINVFGGDIYHGVLNIQKAIKNWGSTPVSSGANKHSQTWYFPTQCVYNVDLRGGIHTNRDLTADDGGSNASANDEYFYDLYYSYENLVVTYVPKPTLFNETSSYFNRICWSEVKINAETSDSWTVTLTDNYYDLDGNYGPINALVTLKGHMYSIQDRSLAVLQINPQAVLQDPNGSNLVMGNGETLNKHTYIALDAGTKHQWSISSSSNAITFVDANKRKIYMFDGQSLQPISDTKGQRGFINKVLHGDILTTDNPITSTGIVSTYDYMNNEFLYTFHGEGTSGGEPRDEKYTLVFSDITDSFTAHYDFTPYIYINNHNIFYTPLAGSNNTNRTKLYLHNVGNYGEFYGTLYNCSVKTVINKSPLQTKVFDNLTWLTESIKDNEEYWDDVTNYIGNSDNVNYLDDTIKRIRCYNEYQNSDWVTLDDTPITGNLRKLDQGFNIHVPRNKVNYDVFPINTFSIFSSAVLTKTEFGERMRDKYMVVDLEYDNESNNRFILHNLTSTFRLSDR